MDELDGVGGVRDIQHEIVEMHPRDFEVFLRWFLVVRAGDALRDLVEEAEKRFRRDRRFRFLMLVEEGAEIRVERVN